MFLNIFCSPTIVIVTQCLHRQGVGVVMQKVDGHGQGEGWQKWAEILYG